MFKIGDFSKIAQVPVSQLRYYADIGLFEPGQVDPFTGYRYYSASQLPALNRILVLKDLGMTLDQIRGALGDQIGAEEVRGMLRLQKAKIEQSLQEELLRLRAVEARLRQIEDEDDSEGLEVVVKQVPAQRFLSMRETFPIMTETAAVVGEMMQIVPDRFGPKLGYMTAILHNAGYSFENVDIEMGFAVDMAVESSVRLPSERVLAVRELPAVSTMATVARLGSYENNCRSYGALGRWLETHDYAIDGVAREVFLEMPKEGCDFVVEIQVPIKPASTALPSSPPALPS
ncbi:MAG: MerR family transcriptional regulator [Acidobacteriota bacterium]